VGRRKKRMETLREVPLRRKQRRCEGSNGKRREAAAKQEKP
jgi:hypothetical protein